MTWRLLDKPLIHPYTIVFVAGVVFNSGRAILYALGLGTAQVLDAPISEETVIRTIRLVTTGLLCFHLGAIISIGGIARRRPRAKPLLEYQVQSRARAICLLFLCISAVCSALVFRRNISMTADIGYSGLVRSHMPVGSGAAIDIVATFLIPWALFIVVLARRSRGFAALGLITGVVYCILTLYTGIRTPAAVVAATYAWVWHRCVQPLRARTVVFFALGLLTLFSFIRETRNRAGYSFLTSIANVSVRDNPVTSAIAEMGGSMLTVAYTLDLVPSTRSFEFGRSYAYSLLAVVPNLFWEIHPTAARGQPSQWLVNTVDPDFAAARGGLGYSFVAEAYLNFGSVGTPVVLFLLGLAWVRLCKWGEQGDDPLKIATLACATLFTAILVRNDSTSMFRGLLWYSLTPYLIVNLLARVRSSPIRVGLDPPFGGLLRIGPTSESRLRPDQDAVR